MLRVQKDRHVQRSVIRDASSTQVFPRRPDECVYMKRDWHDEIAKIKNKIRDVYVIDSYWFLRIIEFPKKKYVSVTYIYRNVTKLVKTRIVFVKINKKKKTLVFH